MLGVGHHVPAPPLFCDLRPECIQAGPCPSPIARLCR